MGKELSQSINIKYDNSQSGLAAENVQGALDEISTYIEEVHISNYPVIDNNLEQNATTWKKPGQDFKAVIIPRCVFDDYLYFVPIEFKVSYAFLKYDNSATKNAIVPFAGGMTHAETIQVGSDPVRVAIPSDCGCVYIYVSDHDISTIEDLFKVYNIAKCNNKIKELYNPVFEDREAVDIKYSIVPSGYNSNSGVYINVRVAGTTYTRAMIEHPFVVQKGEWIKFTAKTDDVAIMAMCTDDENYYFGIEYAVTIGGTAILRGDGNRKVLWVKWADDADITNVNALLDNISIVRGYDSSYVKNDYAELKPVVDINTDNFVEQIKKQLVRGGYTYTFGTVPQLSTNYDKAVVSNNMYWLEEDIVIEYDESISLIVYILGDDGTFKTIDQGFSPLVVKGGRFIIIKSEYKDKAVISDVEAYKALIKISKLKKNNSDLIIDRNQDAINAIVASKMRFGRKSTTYNYNSPNYSKCFTIAHISDVHTDAERYKNFRKFVDSLGIIDAAVLTGDLCIEPTEEQFKTITEVEGRKDVMMAVGNHDRAVSWGTNTIMNLEDTYANMFTARDVETNTGELYYYKDFIGTTKVQDRTLSSPIYKIRVIVLNCYDCDSDNASYIADHLHYSQNQIDWFISTLQDAITNGFAVMVAMHTPDMQKLPASNNKKFYQDFIYSPSSYDTVEPAPIIEDIINAFKHGETLTQDYTWSDISTTVSVGTTFSTAGTFIAYMTGHKHADLVGVSQKYDDQLYLGGNCGCCYSFLAGRFYGEEFSPYARVPGTKSEDCFNVYSINLEDKTIRVVRVGADINDKMEKIDFESYSFD